MIYLKTYENWFNEFEDTQKTEPQKGDYVLLNMNGFGDEEMIIFLNNNIGQVIGTDSNFNKRVYTVSYDYIIVPWTLLPYFITQNDICSTNFSLSSIEYWSKNKEDVQKYLDAKKYNL